MATIDPFTLGYIGAAIWADLRDEEGESLDHAYDYTDLAPESLASAAAVCESFQEAYAEDLAICRRELGLDGGSDLWLTRNGHGTGYWDRGYGESDAVNAALQRLTDGAHAFGEAYIYVGDDDLVHIDGD